jgi:hypothetical protein
MNRWNNWVLQRSGIRLYQTSKDSSRTLAFLPNSQLATTTTSWKMVECCSLVVCVRRGRPSYIVERRSWSHGIFSIKWQTNLWVQWTWMYTCEPPLACRYESTRRGWTRGMALGARPHPGWVFLSCFSSLGPWVCSIELSQFSWVLAFLSSWSLCRMEMRFAWLRILAMLVI